MKHGFYFLLLSLVSFQALAASKSVDLNFSVTHSGTTAATDLGVTPDGHHLSKGGAPFFFLSDTEWVLNERTDSDVTTLLDDRAAKGFSVVQVFATRYWDPAVRTDVNGNYPFVNNDPTLPNAPYWNRWRWIADQAGARGLHLLLIYGEPGVGYAAWTCSSGSTCYEYGRRVGDLFKDKSNVIFCDGSDSHASANTVLWRAMAEGVADGVNGANSYDGQADYSTTMMTYHGYDVTSTFHNDGWLDFYGTEVWGRIADLYDEVNSTYNMTNPTKPSAILEANYEGYSYPDYYTTAYLVRVQVWQVFFAGGMGYAYGNNSNYAPPASTPLDYIYSEGAQDMQVFARFMRARAWWKLVPDQSIVSNPGSGVSRKAAARSTDGNECLIYYPDVEPVTINMGCITAANLVAASWFDPRTGNTQSIGVFANSASPTLTPPSGWEDAVLLLTAAS